VQLLDYSDIELLLSNQNFNISAPKRMPHTHIEQRLFQVRAAYGKSFYSALAGTMAILNTCGDAYFEIRPRDRAKYQTLSRGLLQAGFRLEDFGISVERRTEDLS
jgi:hypothetical protein